MKSMTNKIDMPTNADYPRILVLGGSGFLGARLCEQMTRVGKVVSTWYTREHSEGIHCDLGSATSVSRAVAAARPDIIIHVAGITRPDECEAYPEMAWQVNVGGIRTLARVAKQAKIILFSTDYVFDGERPPYKESDIPHPVNLYGRSKVAAESELLEARADCLVIRVAGLYGTSQRNDEFLRLFQTGGQLRLSKEHVSSCTFLDDICRELPSLLNLTGILHLVGPGAFTRAEFGHLVCQILGFATKIIAVSGKEAYPGVPRPRDTTLVSCRQDVPMTPAVKGLEVLGRQMRKRTQARPFRRSVADEPGTSKNGHETSYRLKEKEEYP